MISYPFESQNTGSAQAPVYDRAITAEQERKFNKMRYTNGVFSTPTNGLMVQAKSAMTVTVKAGGCHIEGALSVLESDLDISISASNASQSRIDRIVARFDTSVSVRSVDIYKKEGVSSSNPQPPDIVRESNYYEIVLADIRVNAGATEITNANITDQRENSDLCGLVVPAIPTPLDLDDLYLQYQASLDEYLELVATALDETTAGHLQGLLDSVIGKNSASSMSVIPTPAFGWGNWNDTDDKYLMITLPKAARNIMAFDICLTMHTYGQAVYHVEGAMGISYTWNAPTNCYATGIVNQSYTPIHDLPIRFGHDSEHAYIIIGDGITSMYNLGVVIRNFSVYGSQREGYDVLAGYQDGWIIDCVSEFSNITIDVTIEHPSMLYDYEISDETIAAFEALGWTPPSGVGGAVIESLLDWISEHSDFYKEKGTSGNWEWKEDTDGNIEAYVDISNNVNINSGNAPVYYNATEVKIAIPDFIFAEYVSIEWKDGGGGLIFPYARIVGQNVQVTYFRFYGGPANLTMTYRLKVKGVRKT